jgi:hypothetical protein
MAEFSVQDVALTGFRVVREHPAALGVWAGLSILLSLLDSLMIVGLGGADANRVLTLGMQPTRPPEEVLAALGRLAPLYAALMGISLVSYAILGAAMNRAVLRPAETRFGFVRFGADELRQLGLGCLMLVVFAAAYLAIGFALGLVVAILLVPLKADVTVAVALVLLGMVVGLAYVWVRLSLAPPLTFDSGRIDLFGSWNLTRGRFWLLLRTYLLALVLTVVVYLLSALVIGAVGAILDSGNTPAAMPRADTQDFKTYFTPFRLVQILLSGGVSALVLPVWFTPPAAIYRHLARSSGVAAASIFA